MNPKSRSASRRGLFAPLAIVFAIAALLSIPVIASADHWPMFGHDGGHSSSQEVDPALLPILQKWRKAEGRVQTSLITTGGADPSTQRTVYGTISRPDANSAFECRVHLQVLATGEPVGPEAGENVCDGTDADNEHGFGTRTTNGSVTPVSSSTDGALGQLYVIHNESNAAPTTEGSVPLQCTDSTNDIAIAQIRESNGTTVKDVAVGRPTKPSNLYSCGDSSEAAGGGQAANNFRVDSSPVLTPPLNANGDRALFFLARNGELVRLFKVYITAAGTDATTFTFQSRDVAGANPNASPSIAYLRDPNVGVLPYVVVPQNSGTAGGITTYRVANINVDGPHLQATTATTGWVPHTPAAPTTGAGIQPGAPASGTDVTPFIYLPLTKNGKTKVVRVTQRGEEPNLTLDLSSPEVNGTVGKAIAVTQPWNGTAFSDGSLVVATDKNLYILRSADLTVRERLQDVVEGSTDGDKEFSGTGISMGFSRTAPAVSGNFIYITDDNGAQRVLRLSDGERVCRPGEVVREECAGRADFSEDPNNLGTVEGGSPSSFGIGQPAVSNRFIQFASNKGVMVYRGSTNNTQAPSVEITEPAPGGKVSGATVTIKAIATDNEDVAGVDFYLEDVLLGTDTSETNGNEYSITFDSTTKPDGKYQISAVARDFDSPPNEGVDAQTMEIDNVKDPVASFTMTPSSPQPTGTKFTFDASGSTPANTPSNQTITKYEWDWEGDGTYDFDAGTSKVVEHTYGTAGEYHPTLRVSQSGNTEQDEETTTLVITNRPPVASFTANPNPAHAGQQVTFDASASKDDEGAVKSYGWDFDGDGAVDQTTTGPTTTHTYQTAGKRTVTLTVTDADGATSKVSRDVEVSGPNVPPTASFAANPNPAAVNQQVVFDASASRDPDGGSIVRYEWDLDGNGAFETNSGSNPRTQRAYATPNVYNVKLRVTDNSGAQTETVRQLTVTLSGARTPDRVKARSFSAKTTPSRDRSLPYVFKTSGKLSLPAGVARVDGCNGRVRVTFKSGRKTISSRTTALRRSCAYSTSVTFRDRKRLGEATRLRVIVRFQGNKRLLPKSARTRSVRAG